MDTQDCMVLLDEGATWNGAARTVASWTEPTSRTGLVSIPQLVEDHALDLRREYLAWTHDLGQSTLGGRSIIELLRLTDDLSAWWLTLISEKSPMKSPRIHGVFKLRALESVYLKGHCTGLVYVGDDRVLGAALQAWCASLECPYLRVTPQSDGAQKSLPAGIRAWAKRLPHWLQAMTYVARLVWHGLYSSREQVQAVEGGATVVTYFPNLDQAAANEGRFRSRLFGPLHQAFEDSAQKINWVWIHVCSPHYNYGEAVRLRDRCNGGQGMQRYFLLEQFADFGMIATLLLRFARHRLRARALSGAKELFRFGNSKLNFFPLLADDWNSSLFGKAAMEGIAFTLLFERMAMTMPHGPWALYVWENHAWEAALVSAWRRRAKEKLIGYQHAMLGRLNLRNFADRRDHDAAGLARRPVPDILALNGVAARRLLLEAGHPGAGLELIEALRYMDLKRPIAQTPRPARTLLVITGYLAAETRFQLQMLDQARGLGALSAFARILIKPHPFLAVDAMLAELRAGFAHTVSNATLSDLLAEADFAFLANSTSAVIDTCASGVPMAICAAPNQMNLNPLFGEPGVAMIASAAGLAAVLLNPEPPPAVEDYLETDSSLPRWRRLLGLKPAEID